MAKLVTTAGRLAVNSVLPPAMQSETRTLDKAGVRALLQEVAQNHPEQYRDISHKLGRIGERASYLSGGNSFGVQHLRKARVAQQLHNDLRQRIAGLLDDDSLTDEQRESRIVEATGDMQDKQTKAVYDESLADNNPLALQLKGAGRGNQMNLVSLRGGDALYVDHRDRVVPVPVLRSFSEGLTPAEYFAGSFGARKGVVATKIATADAGYLGKVLNQITHRGVVSAYDGPEDDTPRGLPTSVDDPDNEGALLAQRTGEFDRNTLLTPKVLSALRAQGVDRLLVRSVIANGTPDGGVYARDAGMREYGRLPQIGESIGQTAAQAIAEPLSQGSLSSKHSGGVRGSGGDKSISGFKAIDQLINVPSTFRGGAAHATVDGTVGSIEPAPAGGHFIHVEGVKHYVAGGLAPTVKAGDNVEAGDTLSEGTPNPELITKYKGIGEGRRYFVDTFSKTMREAGIKPHRRNVELLARGLINHVRATDEVAGAAPDDVLPYSMFEHNYEPREDAQHMAPRAALGRYLEKPVLHYSIGTKIRPSVVKELEAFKVPSIHVHHEEPPFEAEMQRGVESASFDPDPLTKLYGSRLQRSLLHDAARGATSDATGTSFVPGLARGTGFGHIGKVKIDGGR